LRCLIIWYADLALWTARLKGPAGAAAVREQVGNGRACAESVGCRRCSADLSLRSAEALARIGDREAARRMLAAWDGHRRHGDQLDRLIRSHAGALAEEDAGTRAAALEALASALESSPSPLLALWVRLDLGVALAEAGEARAAGELERAVAVAEELGAGTVKELAERALRSLGVRTWRRASAGAPLTDREREVARLVAEGATNREIAELLFLSPKTIERHVSNVFKKVGVRNRAELGSRVSGRELAGS
jgi:DNA-binding NarL/FixJ family response regulator